MTDAPRREQRTLIVELTQRCAQRCLHCYNVWKNDRPYPSGELGTAEMIALLDKVLAESGAREVSLTGGEPLLREDLVEIVDHLVARAVEVDLITGGQQLTEEVIARLAPAKISVFELPLLSSEAAIHDRLVGKEGAFDGVTTAMADLKAAAQRVIAVFVATRLNLHTLGETLEMAFALGVDAVMLNRFNPGGHGLENLELLQAAPEQLREALDVADAFVDRYGMPISCSIAMPPCLFEHDRWPKLTFGFCAAGTEDAYYTIDPLGNLRPCNHSPLILGNLRESSFWALVDSAAMAGFTAARPSFCAGCAEEERCLGGCKAAAEASSGDVTACDPFLNAFADQAISLRRSAGGPKAVPAPCPTRGALPSGLRRAIKPRR
jgi:pyrroloquinoline quinone biosynthesis protein E